MHFTAGKTNMFSVFHLENGQIQSMFWFYVCFNVEIRVIWVKNKLFHDLCTFSSIIIRFFG